LLTEEGEAKVADFGIARALASKTMTATGQLLGTPH
jgi:serine/threonine protein kinase